ncbi:hypothetical protein ACIOD2_32450 [Amycolatopsis sp. NPDC088138]|uniref:hypothetical protein n=1 Tax=Amycolatopsis sp. NPDC088138 TaxID=3363938 RepID=UPI0037F9EADC
MSVYIRRGKHPHEVVLLAAAFLLGLSGSLAFNATATSTARTLPFPFGHLLYAGMAFGAAIALVGVFWPGITGALIERAGLILVSTWSLVYGVVVLFNSGARGIMFGGFMAAFAAASLWRVWQIAKEAREVAAARAYLKRAGGEP